MGVVSVFVMAALTGCGALDVNDPTRLREENLRNAVGATITVDGVRKKVESALLYAVLQTGALTDEFMSWDGGGAYNDLRDDALYTAVFSGPSDGLLNNWQGAYRNATIGLTLIRRSAPTNIKGARLAEIFALRGYVLLGMAEQVCPGFPIINLDIHGESITSRYDSDPQTADSAFMRALVDFDSALAYGSDTVRIRDLANVGKARALLGLGRLTEAGTVAASVATSYVDTVVTDTLTAAFRGKYFLAAGPEGTNGIDFVSAADPRLSFTDTEGWEGLLFEPAYLSNNNGFPSIVVASGIEARLIEAEVQLAVNGNGSTWLNTLNSLRGTVALSDTTDPGTTHARQDLLFRERAFWLFGTAHRLGDMRRLIHQYGRDPETVFPIGTQPVLGAPYGTSTSVPFNGILEHSFNPKITGCTGP